MALVYNCNDVVAATTFINGSPCKPISFSDSDASAVHFPCNDALIITMIIGNCRMSKVLVEGKAPLTSSMGVPLNRIEDTTKLPK